jgi:hypothetical protein
MAANFIAPKWVRAADEITSSVAVSKIIFGDPWKRGILSEHVEFSASSEAGTFPWRQISL